MQTCKLLLTLLLALHCTQGLLAACVCSEKGTDYCQSCQGSSIVRPKARYFEPSEVNLPPIGDNCWCGKQLIEPAQLPKTCGKVRELFQYVQAFNNMLGRRMLEGAIEAKTHAAQRLAERLQRLEHVECPHKRRGMHMLPAGYGYQLRTTATVSEPHHHLPAEHHHQQEHHYHRCKQADKPSCDCPPSPSSYSYDNAYDTTSISSSYHGYGYVNERAQDNSAPADPISVSLANGAGKALAVPEAKLAFGFAKKPVEDKQEVQASNVPEENLFKLKSEVITLRKPTSTNKVLEEEYIEEEEEQESPLDVDETVPQLTYKQLGYIPEQYKNPVFSKVNSRLYYNRDYGYDKLPGKAAADYAYKPGCITSYRNARRQELEGYY